MKTCEYCGRDNEDIVTHCRECGTSLDKETPHTLKDFRQFVRSPLGLAVTSGLASFFISTGIYCAVGRVCLYIFNVHYPKSIVPPYAREVIIMFPSIGRPLMVGLVVFTFAICWIRCQKSWQAILVAIIALGLMAMPVFVPGFLWIVPGVAFGVTTDSSPGYYVGSAFQLAAGAWLLGWFNRRKTQDALHRA